HFVASYDRSTGQTKYYLDGDLKNTTSPGYGTGDNLVIGALGQDASSDNWYGWIDDVAIYDGPMGTDQIDFLAGGGDPNPIPEPATTALLILGGVGALLRRRRK
ncbi:hypothetical protein LCGC14_3162700, partial [marine sediment metagenome]